MILLQSFLDVCPFPSCEFWHLFFQKKNPAIKYIVVTWLMKKGDGKMFWNSGGLEKCDGKCLIDHVVNEKRWC
jgi:hypothetical protein